MDFNATFAEVNGLAAAAADIIPDGFNGNVGLVDMATPADFTGPAGKVVINGAGQINLRGTLRYHLMLAQGGNAADAAVTAAHLEAFWPAFCNTIARARMYTLISCTGGIIAFRATDVVNAPAARPLADAFLNRLYAHMTGAEEREVIMMANAQNVLLSFVANEIHRQQNDGHSWYTDQAANARTPTGRALSVAGKQRAAFAVYMRNYGHDGNHHLTNASLTSICDALTSDRLINHANPVIYMGRDVRTEMLRMVLPIKQAASTRYPAGVLGKSSLIVGLNMLIAMVSSITQRVRVAAIGPVVARVRALLNALSTNPGNPAFFTALEARIGENLAVVYGYTIATNLHAEGDYMAFQSHAMRYPAMVASGRALATTVMSANPHVEAVTGAIVTALTNLGTAINDACTVPLVAGGAAVVPGAAVDLTGITAEVGRSANAEMIETIRALNAAGAPAAAGAAGPI